MAKKKPSPPASADPNGRTALDWPVHTGLVDHVLRRIDEKVRLKRRRRRSRIAIVSAITFLAALGGVVPWLRDTANFTTVPSQRMSVTLPDGSRAELNAQTQLTTDFRYGWRHVQLEHGEAFFTVVTDSAHPFLVTTPRGTVRVTGTMFNVRLSDDAAPEVTLLEGKVQFEPRHGSPVAIAPGEQLFLEGATLRLRKLAANELENISGWREGRLALDGLTLAEVAARLARYHGTTITVEPGVAMLRPGGTVPIENLANILDALQDALPVRIEAQPDGSVRLKAR